MDPASTVLIVILSGALVQGILHYIASRPDGPVKHDRDPQ